MSCTPCVEKWVEYYEHKGFSYKQARKMSVKLVKRIEERLKRNNLPYQPLFILERADGNGVPMQYGAHEKEWKRTGLCLRRIIFSTNWRSTFFWSFRKLKVTWVGKHLGPGANPDYTQACIQSTCVSSSAYCTKKGQACTFAIECIDGACTYSGSCGCPTALSNSSKVSDCSTTCASTGGTCANCGPKFICSPTCTVTACSAGTCGYNCDDGFEWDGTQCVAIAEKPLINPPLVNPPIVNTPIIRLTH